MAGRYQADDEKPLKNKPLTKPEPPKSSKTPPKKKSK